MHLYSTYQFSLLRYLYFQATTGKHCVAQFIEDGIKKDMAVPYVWVDLDHKLLWYTVVDMNRCILILTVPADDWDSLSFISLTQVSMGHFASTGLRL